MSLPAMRTTLPAQPARQEKALETTRQRSATLLTSDGYALATHPSLKPGLYLVTKPEATLDKATGELIESYEVDITAPSCTCKQFEFSPEGKKNCKHLRATQGHIAHCYNLLAPLLADAGLGTLLPAPAALRACPHCKYSDTIALPDHPGQWVCPECLRISDELHDPSFGARKRADAPGARKPLVIAPDPSPAPPESRPGRGVPYCQRCSIVMDRATCERTKQDGHLCCNCGGFLPLGSYHAISRQMTTLPAHQMGPRR